MGIDKNVRWKPSKRMSILDALGHTPACDGHAKPDSNDII